MHRIFRPCQSSFFLLMALALQAQAQSFIQLKGLVLDKQTGEPLPYATVRLKEIPVGTITNLTGAFSFWLDQGYSKGTLQVSTVGYFDAEIPIAQFLEGGQKPVLMTEDIRKLPGVTVISDKLLTGLEVLKRAVKRIPENYTNEQHAFEAYYREMVTENGAVIKYADAAVTFDQTGYQGENYDRGNYGGRTLVRLGSWLGGYRGIFRIGDRLHDHFGHKTHEADKVWVHEVRTSLNHTREQFRPSIEAGPLATLSKDLVKYLRHFIYKRAYDDYHYELAEIDLGNGNWDYLLRFRPKKQPSKLEGNEALVGGKIRKHIFVGSMQIDPETYVIKKLNYEVGVGYRPHICSLGMDDIIHYGYQVDVDYELQAGRWQVRRIKRLDQFLLPESGTEKITPYEAKTEIIVTNPKVDVKVPEHLSFRNKNQLFLQDYHSPYNAHFWKQYELKVPEAVISDSIRLFMEDELNLEAQFALQGTREQQFQPPLARKGMTQGEEGGDPYQWMHKVGESENLAARHRKELAYTEDYFKPFGKLMRDMLLDYKVAAEKYLRPDSLENGEYQNWAEFTDRKGFRKLLKGRKQYNIQTVSVSENILANKLTLIFLGEGKPRALRKRPVILTIEDGVKTGLQRPFDASIIPMMELGFIYAYVNLNNAAELEPSSFLKGYPQQKEVRKLLEVIDFLKKGEHGDPEKIFIRAQGSGAALVASAIHSWKQLCLGAFFMSPLLDPVGLLKSDYPEALEMTKGWGPQRLARRIREVQGFSPYEQKASHPLGNVAFFSYGQDPGHWQSLKFLAKLRSDGDTTTTRLLLDYDREKQTAEKTRLGISKAELKQNLLMLQWLEDQRMAQLSMADLSAND